MSGAKKERSKNTAGNRGPGGGKAEGALKQGTSLGGGGVGPAGVVPTGTKGLEVLWKIASQKSSGERVVRRGEKFPF